MLSEQASLRTFLVRLPSGARYWTVLDEVALLPVAEADDFLRHVRFGRDQAESTTATYAAAVRLYLVWCARTRRDWREAAGQLGAFMFWLRHATGDGRSTVVAGPGQRPVRGPRRVNAVLAGVREFLKHQVSVGAAPVEEISRLRKLIRRVEADLDALTGEEQQQIRDAVAMLRKPRTVQLGMPSIRSAEVNLRLERDA